MKNHPRNTASLALMTVAAFIVTAWPSLVVAEEPAKVIQQLVENGYAYQVFRSQANRPGHEAALITVVQTREGPQVMHGLVFLQTSGAGHSGKGIICGHSDQRASRASHEGSLTAPLDRSFECHQHISDLKETLTIGAIDSEFCDELRARLEPDTNRQTLKGENPIATPDECKEKYPNGGCVCYDIEHLPPRDSDAHFAPPNSGSGTGGHP